MSRGSSGSGLRVGVAGLGGIGLLHARNTNESGLATLAAVASARPESAREVATQLGARPCTYAELMAAADVDAVVVAARSVDHARLGVEVLASGKHLFLEKPGATTLTDHDALRAAAAAHPGLVVQVGYHRRYDAAYVELHRLVSSDAIGEPLVALATSRDVRTPEPEAPGPAGGFLVDMAVHDYDVACWLFGREPLSAFAVRQALVYPELTALGDLDNAVVTIAFDGGGIATTHLSRTCAFGHDVRTEVVGSEGSALVGGLGGPDTVTLLSSSDRVSFPQDYQQRFPDAYRAELDAFFATCAGDGPSGPGLDEDRRALAIGVAARASAVEGAPLAVGPDWAWG